MDTFPLCCGSPVSVLYCDDDRWENRLERICFHKKLSTRIKVCICTDSKEKQGEKALYSLFESQETNSGRGLLPKLLDYLDLIAKLSLKSFLFQLFINDTAIVISSPSFRIKICFNWSRGVLPKNLRRGPYAVVDERCEDTTLDPK